jgi:DNA-binding NtrC family response regulator
MFIDAHAAASSCGAGLAHRYVETHRTGPASSGNIMIRRPSSRRSSGTDTHVARELKWVSPIMRPLEDDMACAIQSDSNVLISGESGAGKKFVAQAIHQRSRRRSAPFVIANWPACFSNAAGNGTLLIDDIEKITPRLQLELLRFTDRDSTNPCELRLMTVASTDVFARVQINQFRSDLFYRLNVMHLKIPALRDRPEDIPILFHHYLRGYARAHLPRLSSAATQRLVAYAWPGNVSELKTTARALAQQDLARLIEPNDLPSPMAWS